MGINLNNTITTIVRSFMEAIIIIIVTRPLLAIATSKVTNSLRPYWQPQKLDWQPLAASET